MEEFLSWTLLLLSYDIWNYNKWGFVGGSNLRTGPKYVGREGGAPFKTTFRPIVALHEKSNPFHPFEHVNAGHPTKKLYQTFDSVLKSANAATARYYQPVPTQQMWDDRFWFYVVLSWWSTADAAFRAPHIFCSSNLSQ